MKFIHCTALMVAAFTLISCSWSKDQVKNSSALKKAPRYQKTGFYDEATVRKQILKELPLGSSFEDTQNYCRNNFKGSKMERHDLSRSQLKDVTETNYISFRIAESGTFPIGSDWLDVVFFFDVNNKFTRLIIDKYGVWM